MTEPIWDEIQEVKNGESRQDGQRAGEWPRIPNTKW